VAEVPRAAIGAVNPLRSGNWLTPARREAQLHEPWRAGLDVHASTLTRRETGYKPDAALPAGRPACLALAASRPGPRRIGTGASCGRCDPLSAEPCAAGLRATLPISRAEKGAVVRIARLT
jgi:hypothetical protein